MDKTTEKTSEEQVNDLAEVEASEEVSENVNSEEFAEENAEVSGLTIGFSENQRVQTLKAYMSSNKTGKVIKSKKFQKSLEEIKDTSISQFNSEQLMLIALMVQYEEQMAADLKENYSRFIRQESLIN